MTFRVLKRFYEPCGKKLSPHFEDNFFSNEDQVSCRGFFIRGESGLYSSYLCENFVNAKPKDWEAKQNDSMSVTFDENGFPQVSNINITLLNSDEILWGSLNYSIQEAVIKGQCYKVGSDQYVRDLEIVYKSFNNPEW